MGKSLSSTNKISYLLALITAIFLFNNVSYAQCGLSGFSATSNPLTPTNSFQSVSAGSGSYVDFNVVAGNIYSFYYTTGTDASTNYIWDMTVSRNSAVINYDNSLTPIPDSWTGGIGCPNTVRPGSAEWYSNYTGTFRVNINSWDAINSQCVGWSASGGSATLEYKVCTPSPDPNSGASSWNVDAYATTNINIPNTNVRYGYYNDATSNLDFNTTHGWLAGQNPSDAAGWSGCVMPDENYVVRARRKGFPCNLYRIDARSADEEMKIYLNGTELFDATNFNSTQVAGSSAGYVLTANDSIEIRLVGTCGNNAGHVTLVPLGLPPLVPGTIGGVVNNSTPCEGSQLGLFTNTGVGSGGTSGLNNGLPVGYNWEMSTNGGPFTSVGVSTVTWNSTVIVQADTVYSVRRAVFDGCGNVSYSDTITVTGHPLPNGSFTPTSQIICAGGTASLTAHFTPAANGPFNITYTDGVNNFTLNNVNDGDVITVNPAISSTYRYTAITDQVGCTRTSNFTGGALVLIDPSINIAVNVGAIACNGGNATITVNASGGTGSLQYSDDAGANYQVSNVFTVLPGTYNVVVKDSVGCSANYTGNPLNITQPSPISFTLSEVDASCPNVFDGTITVNATGGTTPYSYSLNHGPTQPFNVFTGVGAGTYLVTTFDANGCFDTASISVGNIYTISVDTLQTVPTSCFGVNDGGFTVQVNNGVPAYQYSLNGITYQPSGTFSGLASGTYIVVGRDSRGCTEAVNVHVPGATVPTTVVIDSIINVVCNGVPTGAIYISVAGGNAPLTYAWSNNVSTQDNIGIPGGTYSVTVTDAHNCPPVVAYATVNSPTAVFLNIALYSNPLCNGDSTGYIYSDANGGTPPYTFAWSNSENTQSINGLAANSYTLTVTDANNCTSSITQVLTEPTVITENVTGTDVSCHGASNGTATVNNLTGGAPPYTFLWSNFNTNQTAIGLSGGLYRVNIYDHNGCVKQDSITIHEGAPLVITPVVTDISCFNSNDGSITVVDSGGTQPYSYQWGGGSTATSQTITGLAGGTYTVTVTDANGCSASAVAFVVNPPRLITSFVITNEPCYADSNGIALSQGALHTITTGGSPNYSYQWSYNNSTDDSIVNLPVGSYSVTVTDTRNCSISSSANITAPPLLYASGDQFNVTCNGKCDGYVLTAGYGGTPPYSFQWNDNTTSENHFQLCPGDYYLTVTDVNGCIAPSHYVITEPAVLTATFAKTDLTCNGVCNGAVAALPTGGTRPYQYLWNNFSVDSSQTGICAGHYSVQIVDTNACRFTGSIDITEPTAIVVTGAVTNVLCNGFNTGSIALTVTGGVGQYTYAWTNSGTTSTISGLAAGTYTVTVSDGNGCSVTASFTVTQSYVLQTAASNQNPRCFNGNDGFVSVVVSGGTPPYVYNWNTNPGQIGATATNLAAGVYTLTVTDANNCSATISSTLANPDQLVITTSPTPAHCYNTATGMVTASVSGGTPPYIVELNGAAQSADTFYNLAPGSYIVVAVDANGCQAGSPFQIAGGSPVSVTLTAPDNTILTGMQTQLVATATSDSSKPIIGYIWSPLTIDSANVFDFSGCSDPNNCSNPYVKPPFTATFTVTVYNSDSCSATDTVTVYVKNDQSAFIPTAFTPNDDGLNDRFEFDILGANTIEITIFDRWGGKVYYNAAQTNGMSGTNGWDGKVNGKDAPSDTYVYQMKVTYFNGAVKDRAGTVTLMR